MKYNVILKIPSESEGTFNQDKIVNIAKGLGYKLLPVQGAYNKFWVSLFKDYGIKLHIPDRLIIDYKEALIFALLGILKINDQINVLSSVTGATKNSSSGTIYMPEI